jgi:hypothetical protein
MEKHVEKEESYDNIIRHFDELESSYHNKNDSSNFNLNHDFSFTEKYMGLTKGNVQNVIMYDNVVEIFVNMGNSTHKYQINTTGEYNKDNEFARFLEFYDISVQSPSDLFGMEVTLKKDITGWNVYIPNKITKSIGIKYISDIIARCFGYHQLNIKRNFPAEIYLGAIILLSVSITFSTILYNMVLFMTSDVSMWLFVFILISTPFFASISSRLRQIYFNSNKHM